MRTESLNLRRLRPSELATLLNSTPLGTVANERQLRRHRIEGGLRIGDGTHVDIFRYAAWLTVRHRTPHGSRSYEEQKEAARERAARLSKSGRDIGELPPVADAQRRASAENDFRMFCETYFGTLFYLPWSDDHLAVVNTIERTVNSGGQFALAMPRGSGKTTLCEVACLWALLSGKRRFVVLVGAEEAHAIELLQSMKVELLCNDLLLADWPEVMYPFRRLEGIAHRSKGQLYQGKPTHVAWAERQIVFASIPGSPASGAIVRASGLLGRLRGMKHTRPDGRAVRPDLVIVDDPQTEASAISPLQSARREHILTGAILNLAGPGQRIAAVMPCTVIQAGDMADNLLDRRRHPEWHGERFKLVYRWPDNEKLWERYAKIYRDPGRAQMECLADATEFYRDHRAEMDAGAKVAWPARYEPGEISAIQHAYNLRLRDEPTFFAEYMNEPQRAAYEGDFCSADQIAAKLNGLKRGEVPTGYSLLTGHVDVHDKLLYFVIAAWNPENFSGAVIDYGTYPRQRRRYFTLRQATATLGRQKPGAGKEGAIHAGLVALLDDLLAREWKSVDGQALRIGRMLVDEGYKPETVRAAIRVSKYAALIQPCKGVSVRAAHKPLAEYINKAGDVAGHYWRTGKAARRELRGVMVDINWWKSRVHTAFGTARGDPGSLELWGKTPEEHRMYAEHLADSEYMVMTTGRGRTVHEWFERPGRPDNHLFDSTVGAAVAASISGAKIPGSAPPKPRRRRRKWRYL